MKPPSLITLHPFTAQHARDPRIAALLGDSPVAALLELEAGPGLVGTIVVSGTPAGFITVMKHGDVNVAVHTDFRRLGVATTAIASTLDDAFDTRACPGITARTKIGAAGTSLADSFREFETSRSGSEVFYSIAPSQWQAFRRRKSGS